MNHALGQASALVTAFVWAVALVLFKLSGERVSPVALNLFKNSVGLLLVGLTIVGLMLAGEESLRTLTSMRTDVLCLLLLSGFLGIAVADTLFFHGLNLIGVGLIAVVDCTYAPFTILFGWLLLSEQLTAAQYVGVALVVAGVFTATQHEVPHNRTRRQMLLGIVLAAAAIGLMAFGIVIVTPDMRDIPLMWATGLRLAGGTMFLALFSLLGPSARRNWRVFLPARVWRVAVPAAVLGTYVCLVLWIAGYKYTYVAVAAALNQTSVVFQTICGALILRERYGWRQLVALVLAFVGVMFVIGVAQELADALGRWYLDVVQDGRSPG